LIFASGALFFWFAVMFHYLLMAFETSRQTETRGLGLEILAREAELKALRAQIDPHFLFNSLNSISALTTADPSGARRMCLLLADFFRSSVRLASRDMVPLSDEIAMVRQYLEIEKVRFGSRLETAIAMEPECESCPVPPLILQPLVENAVRHGINSLIEGGAVRIHRSYILNVDCLARLELYAKDSHAAILRDGKRLTVSRAGYAKLTALLK
jgi:LytS/YehU family sensor histidine kinase